MAFNRLRDIRDRMESKWSSGQFVFGYEDDINELHNIDYPLLLVIPPTSTLPATEKDPINAHLKEEYEFEVIFAKPYRTSSSNTGANDTNANLDVIYTLLESEAHFWLQSFLDSYPNKQVTLVPVPITIERETNQQNDRVVQVRMNFTVDCFSHAFAAFDDQSIRDLTPQLWLRSDIGVKTKYFGGKEVVSQWKDQSGFNNHFSQSTSANQPEYKYEMSDSVNVNNRYPFLSFDGVDDNLICEQSRFGNPAPFRSLNGDHSIFYVAKTTDSNEVNAPLLSLGHTTASLAKMSIVIKDFSGEKQFTSGVSDVASSGADTMVLSSDVASGSTKIAIRGHKVSGQTLSYFLNGVNLTSVTNTDYLNPVAYTEEFMLMGTDLTNFGLLNVQEVMIFQYAVTDSQATSIMNYLNHKYNIS
tara:strand:+ start:2883 stop:4127 length:1245 start_codon:yes stop_codon:yes gene_type:complete